MVRLIAKVNRPLENGALACYEGILDGRDDWLFDMDETLPLRSFFEFAREMGQLDARALAELDQIDAFWRAHPQAFDAAFAYEHAADKARALEGFVEDEHGNPVPPPPSHWWWRPSERW